MGNTYLKDQYYQDLDKAQHSFTEALKIYEYGRLAQIGLTNTLLKKCTLHKKYCIEAEAYLEFLKAMDYYNQQDFEIFEKRKVQDH